MNKLHTEVITEAIVLAGGLGTRIRSVLPGIPKCLAPVNGKPFLEFVIDHFKKEGVQRFIFSTGYKSELIELFLENLSPAINYIIEKESNPLGTGGAVKIAAIKAQSQNVIVINGDTLFTIKLNVLSEMHFANDAECTLSLKPMMNFDRYGVVEINPDQSVRSFKEKQFYNQGLINGGVYALNLKSFLNKNPPEVFSFEKDYLEKSMITDSVEKKFFSVVQDEYFIDIGVPEDFEKANKELNVR